ncbi:MAG: PEP-CTERM sorting domain-containing protein [Myxococcota bacterium]|nr:PEP-CTERM sorting domain-containing protein [Myxococcota bacterium]
MRNLYFYAVSAVLLLASPAWSLSVTVDSLAFGASNTPDTDAGSNANTSVIQTIAAGGALADAVGASESAGVRYSANQWADATFGNTQIDLTHSYDITITVSANAGTVYDISIDTIFSGMVQRIDDSFSGYGDASVSTATVQLDQNSGGAAAVAGLSTAGGSIPYYWDDDYSSFSSSGLHNLTGLSGTNQLSFSVQFTSTANSDSDEAGVLLGQDEAYGPTSFLTVSEYGVENAEGRNMSADGHFLGVTATVTSVVPEPSTALLLGLGLLGLGIHGRRHA